MLEPVDWRPSARLTTIRRRAELLEDIRQFFRSRSVVEVETPLLCRAVATDLHLQGMGVELRMDRGEPPRKMYLQTSPEGPMKRILAAGSGPIYQICKAFRNGESGSAHSPEFTVLEWYRPGWSLNELADEVQSLVESCTQFRGARRLDYRDAMREHAGLDPFACDQAMARQACVAHGAPQELTDSLDLDQSLDFLMSHQVQPNLESGMCFLFGFPASQAAMAALTEEDPPRAARFELYLDGLELANGYFELTDSAVLRNRMRADQAARRSRGLPVPPVDERLLAAMAYGLPECSGVALGVDRLLMANSGLATLSEALSFDTARA